MARKRHERRLQAKFSHSDLLQITSLQAFENLHQFHGNTFEEFGCWLLGIMDHTVAGQNRKYHRPGRDITKEIPLETVWDRLTARQVVSENDETSQRLKAALDKLPETYRKLVVWHYYEKKSHQEIGNLIGASADAAKHTCHRAVGKLAFELCKEMEGQGSRSS
jgi:RNA polymerase sigma-70 factor (ECF subfamily)